MRNVGRGRFVGPVWIRPVLGAGFLASGALAQSLLGPGLPNLTYTQSELFKTLSTLHPVSPGNTSDAKGLNVVAMHKGYLFAIFGEDSGRRGGGLIFWDISNPRQPKLVHSRDVPDLRESHGVGFHSYNGRDYAAMQSVYGVHIWDMTDVRNPVLVKDFRIPGVSDSDYDFGAWWVHWAAPYIFVARGQDGFSIVDATDLANPKLVDMLVDGKAQQNFPISKTGNFKLGPIFVVGNLLVATNMGTGRNPGYATIDVSDVKNPRLLDTDNSTSCYATFMNGSRIYCAGVDAVNGMLVVHDVSNPADIRKVGQSAKAGGRGEYVSVQDDYAHMGVEDVYAKFDTRNFSIVHNSYKLADEPGNSNTAQEGFANVLGNLVLVTDDHSIGSSLIPHQTGPDNNPPKVNMVSPRDSAVNQKLTSRIGVTFTDQIDVLSLNKETFIVRPLGGEALDGRYSHQTNIVNFTPLQPLAANTIYEIVVPNGGVKDYAGNATSTPFISRFSTGATLASLRGGLASQVEKRFGVQSRAGGYDFTLPASLAGEGLSGAGSRAQGRLTLHDAKGMVVREWKVGHVSGSHTVPSVHWDGRNAHGEKVRPGLIVATLRIGAMVQSQNLVLP